MEANLSKFREILVSSQATLKRKANYESVNSDPKEMYGYRVNAELLKDVINMFDSCIAKAKADKEKEEQARVVKEKQKLALEEYLDGVIDKATLVDLFKSLTKGKDVQIDYEDDDRSLSIGIMESEFTGAEA